jgi:hypothetical protein
MENTAKIRRTGRQARPLARCRRNQAQSFAKRTRRDDRNGFLNHVFQPFWSFSGNRERTAREFNNALANLCGFYGLPLPQTALPFPQNIYAAWETVAKQVQDIDRNSHCMILEDKGKKAVLAVIKTLDLRQCLFYIPVKPFWEIMQCAQKQGLTEVLTAIFAYLHQVVDIPFYAEDYTFMDNQYETLYQWIMEAEDEGNTDEEQQAWRQEQEDTLYELRRAGGHIMPLIKTPDWLTKMAGIVAGFCARNNWEQQCAQLAADFLQLYQDYPKQSLPDCIHPDLVYPNEDERITVYQYTSFYWSDNDCFQDEFSGNPGHG